MDVPLSLLADLQAGRLDDDTAARVRRLARTDPAVAEQLAALDRVRRDLAALGVDEASAPEVPGDVTARVSAALRARRPRPSRWRRPAAVAGIFAFVVAAGVGTAQLQRRRHRPACLHGHHPAVRPIVRTRGTVGPTLALYAPKKKGGYD